MRLHTNTTILPLDIMRAIRETSPDLFVGGEHGRITQHASRSHAVAYEVRLRGIDGKDSEGTTRRLPMYSWKTGETDKAATYHEWGVLLAKLFDIMPSMKVAGTYDNAADFHQKTRYEFA